MAKSRMDLPAFIGKLLEEQDGDVLREGVRVLAQALMEAEVTELVGAERHERSDERTTYRNGSRTRSWDTRVGTIELEVPKVRTGSHYPSLLQPRRRAEQALRTVVQEAYVHGVSTRKVDDLVKALGLDGISKSQVSRMCQELDTVVEPFRTRPLSAEYPYLWLDATYHKVRVDGRVVSQATAVAIGVTADGERQVLGVDAGASEGGAVYEHDVHRAGAGGRRAMLDGRARAVPGQRLHRAAVAVTEVRSGVSARADRRVRGRAGNRGVDDVLQRRTSALCARRAHAGRGLRRGAGSVTMRAAGSSELAVIPAFGWHPQRSASCPALRSRAEDSRAAERQRPPGRGLRAREHRLQARLAQQPTPTVPTVAACAKRTFRGTRVVARRNDPSGSSWITPSSSARSFRLARVPRPGMPNADVRPFRNGAVWSGGIDERRAAGTLPGGRKAGKVVDADNDHPVARQADRAVDGADGTGLASSRTATPDRQSRQARRCIVRQSPRSFRPLPRTPSRGLAAALRGLTHEDLIIIYDQIQTDDEGVVSQPEYTLAKPSNGPNDRD